MAAAEFMIMMISAFIFRDAFDFSARHCPADSDRCVSLVALIALFAAAVKPQAAKCYLAVTTIELCRFCAIPTI